MRPIKDDENIKEVHDAIMWDFKFLCKATPKETTAFRNWVGKISSYHYVPEANDILAYAKENKIEIV